MKKSPLNNYALIGITLFLSSCCTSSEKKPIDVGSSHIAVLSVTDWDDYKSTLAPKFNLTEKDAVALSIPDTVQSENGILDSRRTGFGLQLAPSSVLQAGFAQTPTGSTVGADGKVVGTPGVTTAGTNIPTSSFDAASPRIDTTAGAIPATISKEGLKTDPFLSYTAATALFQEVKMLERYVLNPPIDHGWKAYIIRLQISSMPYTNDESYDTYANIGFYLNGFSPGANIQDALKRTRGWSTTPPDNPNIDETEKTWSELSHVQALDADENSLHSQSVKELKRIVSDAISGLRKIDIHDRKGIAETVKKGSSDILQAKQVIDQTPLLVLPKVIPLLVTDQVEAALNGRRAETLAQISTAIAAAYAGIGAKFDLQKVNQEINKTLGRDVSSLFTVARLADNSVRVRIGANRVNSGTGGIQAHAIPRTHNVTLLVMLPKLVNEGIQTVSVGAKWEYRNATTGNLLSAGENSISRDEYKSFNELLASGNYISPDDTKPLGSIGGRGVGTQDDYIKIITAAQANDYPNFITAIQAIKVNGTSTLNQDPKTANRLWLDLNSWKLQSQYDTTNFEVETRPIKLPKSAVTSKAYMIDDGEIAVAKIPWVSNIDVDRITAIWKNIGIPSGNTISLNADRISFKDGHLLEVKFPSLIKLKLVPSDEVKLLLKPGEILLSREDVNDESIAIESLVISGQKPKPKAKLKVTSSALTLVPDTNSKEQLVLRYDILFSENSDQYQRDFTSLGSLPTKTQLEGSPNLFQISFDGCDVALKTSPIPKAIQVSNTANFVVPLTGSDTFEISNVPAGGSFKVKFTNPDNFEAPETIEFKVAKKSEGS